MKQSILFGIVGLLVGLVIGCCFATVYQKNSTETTSYRRQAEDNKTEIPATWSTFFQGDVAPVTYKDFVFSNNEVSPYIFSNNYTYSIGQNNVSYGDTNWTQIDVANAAAGELEKVVQELKRNPTTYEGTWSTETVDGKSADVLTFPLDNGEVTKGGTGGKVYFIAWQDGGVVIWKQALGNEEFEQGFSHFIQTVQLQEQL